MFVAELINHPLLGLWSVMLCVRYISWANIIHDTETLSEVFRKWNRTFIEFSEFRESDKSLKHDLGSILLHVSYWCCGSILVSYTRSSKFEPSYTRGSRFEPFQWIEQFFLSLNLLNSVKTFRENSNTIDLHVNVSLGLKSWHFSHLD